MIKERLAIPASDYKSGIGATFYLRNYGKKPISVKLHGRNDDIVINAATEDAIGRLLDNLFSNPHFLFMALCHYPDAYRCVSQYFNLDSNTTKQK